MNSTISRRAFVKGTACGTCAFAGANLIAADKRDLAQKWSDNVFLNENFAPVHEEVTAENLPVVGKVPLSTSKLLFEHVV